jgi:hypothetical protein
VTGARDGRYELTATSVQWACVDCGATVPVEMRAVHDRWHGDQPPERCEHQYPDRCRCTASRPSLAEQQARYLEVRQHTLSTAGLDTLDALRRKPLRRRRGEELGDAGDYLAKRCGPARRAAACRLRRRRAQHVRHEIADVVLAATTLAGMLGTSPSRRASPRRPKPTEAEDEPHPRAGPLARRVHRKAPCVIETTDLEQRREILQSGGTRGDRAHRDLARWIDQP